MLFALLFAQSLCERSKQCTARKTLFDITEDNVNLYVGSPRATFVRMQNEGCGAAPRSEGYWREAAELFPNILFVRAECLKHKNLCLDLGSNNSPSHSLFEANNTKPVESFANPNEIGESSIYYSDVIYKKLGYYPFDSPTVEELLPQSTNSFYESYKYPIFILYDSGCFEDVDFVAQWLIDVNEEEVSSDDYGFGRLDCSKYPDECSKWGSKYPSANIFSSEKGISITITELDDIGNRVADAVAALEKSSLMYPTPPPYHSESPVEPEIANVEKIGTPELQTRDLAVIRTKYYEAIKGTGSYISEANFDAHSCSDYVLPQTAYIDVPSLINFYRELAGLPHNVANDAGLNDGCYQAAKFKARSLTGGHDADDSSKNLCDSFAPVWNDIKVRLAQSLVSKGTLNVLQMVTDLLKDEGANNEGSVGHRRWFLYPHLETVGIGFYPMCYHRIDERTRIIYSGGGVFNVGHNTMSLDDYTGVNFVAWPPAGPFPFADLPSSWSVSYKKFKSGDVKKEDIIVKVTRDDGAKLDVVRVDLIQNERDALSGCLVFKLSQASLKMIAPNREVHVQVFILNDKVREVLDYNIEFFDNTEIATLCFYSTNKQLCPSSVPEHLRFGPGEYSFYNAYKPRTIINVVEDVSLTQDFRLDFGSEFIFKGNGKVSGRVIISPNNRVEFSEPTNTDFVIEPNADLKCGVLRTQREPKSITVKFNSPFTSETLMRSLLYVGPYHYINVQKKVYNGDFLYFVGLAFKGQEVTIVVKPFPLVENYCQGGYDEYDFFHHEESCHRFSDYIDLEGQKTRKKRVKYYFKTIDATVVPLIFNNPNVDYEVMVGKGVSIQYSSSYESKAKTITVKPFGEKTSIEPFFFNIQMNESIYTYLQMDLSFVYENYLPFKNLYLSNVVNKQYSYLIPDLLGDEEAKRIFAFKGEESIYDERKDPFANSDGSYSYPLKKQFFPLFITNGLHSQYTISSNNNYERFRFQPTQEFASMPVTFVIDRNILFKGIIFLDYKNLTIKATKEAFQKIRIHNVDSVKFIETDGQPIANFESDISGGKVIKIASDASINYRKLNFRSDSLVDLSNNKCESAYAISANPTIKNADIDRFNAYESSTTFTNSKVRRIAFHIPEYIPPSIIIKNSTNFDPEEIEIKLLKVYSAKLLSIPDDVYFLLFASDDENVISRIQSKIYFSSKQSYQYYFKVVKSKDNKGLYLTNHEFDESKAPDEVTFPKPIEDPEENPQDPGHDYDVNTPTPVPPTENPSKPVEEPTKPIDEPSKPIEDPSKPIEDPSKPIEDPSKPIEDPSKPIEDPSKPIEDPSKPIEDPSKPIEDPSKPAEDPSKPTQNPDKPDATSDESDPSDPSEPSDSNSSQKKKGFPIGAIIGIVVGVVAIAVGVVVFIYMKRKKTYVSSTDDAPPNAEEKQAQKDDQAAALDLDGNTSL